MWICQSFLLLVLCAMYRPLMSTSVCMHTHMHTLSGRKGKKVRAVAMTGKTPCGVTMIDLFS